MTERPILFSAPMVRALLDGRKTQTRRVVKPQPVFSGASGDSFEWHGGKELQRAGYGATYVHTDGASMVRAMLKVGSRYGSPGDRLWVRETWAFANGGERTTFEDGTDLVYRADVLDVREERSVVRLAKRHATKVAPWRPSIHMPRIASRITLEVTGVRVEKLTHITYADSKAEGLSFVADGCARYGIPGLASSWNDNPRASYQALWESINGAGSWDSNPWVWVIEFKRVTP